MHEDDDYDEFLDRIRKMFNLDKDHFDVDFLIMPESALDPDSPFKDDAKKGIKVTYHFEPGMEKPEIKIEGNFDAEKFQRYLENLNIKEMPRINQIKPNRMKEVIDAKEMMIDPCLDIDESCIIEPYSEVTAEDGHCKIIIEVPGIEKGHVLLSLDNKGKTLKFLAESNVRKYEKFIPLPAKSTMQGYSMNVNNGIATIILRKL